MAGDSPAKDERWDEAEDQGSKLGALVFFGLGLLALGVIVYLLLTWILGDESSPNPDSAAADLGITLGEVVAAPGTFAEERVVVSGTVSEVLVMEPAALIIGGDLFGDNGEVLVLSEDPVPLPAGLARDPAFVLGDVVQVVGIVRDFDRAEIEEFLGVDLATDEFSGREDTPVIVATAIDLSPRVPSEIIGAEADIESSVARPLPVGDDANIGGSVDLLTGRRVIARSVVVDIVAPFAYVSANEVLVLGVDPEVALLEGANTLVTGVVRPFDLMEVETLLDLNLDDSIFERFDGEPAIIADDVVVLTPVEAIASNPGAYAGLFPTVLGEIDSVIGPNAFVIQDQGEELLVVTDAVGALPLEQASALGTGWIVSFNILEIEDELGVDLDDEEFERWEGQPALLAAEVEIIR